MIPFIIRLLLGWKYNTGIYIRISVEFLRSSWEIDWLTEIETGFESVLEMFTFVIVALILVLICQLFLWLCIVIFLYTLSPAFILGGFTSLPLCFSSLITLFPIPFCWLDLLTAQESLMYTYHFLIVTPSPFSLLFKYSYC